jgi:beta-lactamase superfamily II metal-dependent hydrolase
MTVRYVDDTDVYILPQPTITPGEKVSGVRQQLLGSWLDADLQNVTPGGWVPVADRKGNSGFVRLNQLRDKPLLKVFYIDVGQGDATVVETEDGILVIDGGPSRGLRDWMLQHYDPVIQDNGKLQIETVVISHFDKDHDYGITSLLKRPEVHVKRIFHNGLPRYSESQGRDLHLGSIDPAGDISTDLNDIASAISLRDQGLLASKFAEFVDAVEAAHNAGRLGKMEKLYRRNVSQPAPRLTGFTAENRHIDVLAPVPVRDQGAVKLPVFGDPHKHGSGGTTSHTINGNSIVLCLNYGGFQFLFGGDLNQPAQNYLLGKYPGGAVFSADVNKACHHGSADFEVAYLDAVKPQATVFSSGDNGSYDHPMPDAIGAAARHTDVDFPLVFSTELARETGSGGILYGHINARSNGSKLIMAQRKESATAKKTWYTFPVPYPGPFG